MYLTNKYTTWYYNIIFVAQQRNLTTYTEKHHIIPKCLGGSNKKDNLVKLTPREHFVCHRLLTKMTTGAIKHKMIYAAWRMCNQTNRSCVTIKHKINSRFYNELRKQVSQMIGSRIWTTEMREAARQRTLTNIKNGCFDQFFAREQSGSNNARYGKKHTAESKAKMSMSAKARIKENVTCYKCGFICDIANAARYHGDKCQKKALN